MVFYFYPELPITDWGSVVCPLTGKGKIARVQLRRDTTLVIHSLFVPIGNYYKSTTPAILAHSKYVKSLPEDDGGYDAILNGKVELSWWNRYWAKRAKGGVMFNFATGSMRTTMKVIPQGIVMWPGYDKSTVGKEALYVDAADNYKWNSKKIVRMRGVKQITYRDGTIHDPVLIDFEKFKAWTGKNRHDLVKAYKIYYVTTGGKLESTKTNDRYDDSNKSDLEQLADTNPSYLLRRTKSTGGTNNPLTDGFVLSDDGKDVTVYNDVTLYSIYPQYSAITTQPFWGRMFTLAKMTTAIWLTLSKKTDKAEKVLYEEMIALKKLWPEEQWWQLRAVKNSTPAVIPPIVTPRVDDTYLSITKYFVTRQALDLYFAGSAFTVDPNVVLSFRDNGKDMVLHLPTVKGWSPDLLESNVALEKAKRATNTNIIFLLYNEYVNRIYYTPSNITTPLIGTVVVERQFPKNYPDNYVYRNITKTPVRGIFADDVLTNQLEIQISDLGGRPLETVLDDSDNRRPIKDILLDLNGTDDMTSRRQPSFTRGVLVSQEPSRKYNNPIEAVIDNQELLTEMRQHLARGGRIVCEVVEVTIPSKFAYESNYRHHRRGGVGFSQHILSQQQPTLLVGGVHKPLGD